MCIDNDGVLATITIDRFLIQIGGSYDNAVTKNEKSYEVSYKPLYIKYLLHIIVRKRF